MNSVYVGECNFVRTSAIPTQINSDRLGRLKNKTSLKLEDVLKTNTLLSVSPKTPRRECEMAVNNSEGGILHSSEDFGMPLYLIINAMRKNRIIRENVSDARLNNGGKR